MDYYKKFVIICAAILIVTIALNYIVKTDDSKFLQNEMDITVNQGEEDRMDGINMLNVITTKRRELSIPAVKADKRMELYKERNNIVMQGCETLNRTFINSSTFENVFMDEFHHIYYCPMPKVGSTFWKRILTVYSSNGRLKSPFEITLKDVKLKSAKSVPSGLRNSLYSDWESFLFVRDPYARLFSGYENKIYQPNRGFWKSIGSKVILAVRKMSNRPYPEYGYNVTFPEFIKYIIHVHEHDQSINKHFSAMNKICDPCQTHFKYIGHLETLTDDAEYLLSKWRRQFNDINLKFDDLYKEAAIDTARGHVRFLFETKEILATIQFPFIKLMLRTWRDLQIRGYISKFSVFPYEGDVSEVTQDEFLDKIASALAQPQNRSAVKLQRTEALIQAYRQVPLEDMEKLRQFVLTDCTLFGYDDRPKLLFDRTQSPNNDFPYLDGLN